MNLTTEQIQAVLDGAPDGATHCTDTAPSMNLYAKIEHLGGFYVSLSNRWEPYPIYAGIHLLSDLREILTLRQEVERLKGERFAFAEQAVIQALLMFGKENTTASSLGIWYREWYTQQLREQGDE